MNLPKNNRIFIVLFFCGIIIPTAILAFLSFRNVQSELLLTEKNFEDYLRNLRINKACELLLSSDDDIISVSLAVGYNNTKSFTRNFEKVKGITPGNFRKKHFYQPDHLDAY